MELHLPSSEQQYLKLVFVQYLSLQWMLAASGRCFHLSGQAYVVHLPSSPQHVILSAAPHGVPLHFSWAERFLRTQPVGHSYELHIATGSQHSSRSFSSVHLKPLQWLNLLASAGDVAFRALVSAAVPSSAQHFVYGVSKHFLSSQWILPAFHLCRKPTGHFMVLHHPSMSQHVPLSTIEHEDFKQGSLGALPFKTYGEGQV
eukprot:CAMPEP_0115483514 /NCGR_PEP_ID=MMETSP0271-20121206/58895_1 /TAXON_ID=71861 /ORGANISM="Scrippsiella trochoidea, Strain CCMP3099" /LENGTH=201 /DNA_ID=CAMNT_0002911367 /DNA_START=644 /DNA_END=1250 /DNA_ORIENTATION=-